MLFLSRKSLVVTAVAVVCALSLVSCKGFFVDPTLSSIAFGQPTPSVAIGATFPMQAIGTYSDTSTKDITSKVTWTSSDKSFFTVDNAGVITGVAVTSTPAPTVKATLGTVSASTTVTVTAVALTSIAIQGGNQSLSIASNPTFQFNATGTYSDSTQSSVTTTATWSSSDTSVATIQSGATNGGLATLVKAGTTTIKVQQGSVNTSITLTVTN
jgi:trimeric autotransporter adhesin